MRSAPRSLLLLLSLLVTSMHGNQIARTFQANNFESSRGLFGLLTNCHYQTIIGSEALRVKFIGNIPRNFGTINQRLETKDSDFFDVEFSDNVHSSLGLVVVLHGLESSTKGPLVTKMASSFINAGFSVCLMSFRGCSGEDNLTQGAYHLGFTTDVHQLIEYINNKHPKLNIYLSGFSLGGNVCLKYLSEIGENCEKLNCKGAVVTSVPFDPVASQHKIDQGFNRLVYSENFLATLKQKAERKYELYKEKCVFDINKIRQCRTIGDFDEYFIAPVYNYQDKLDYYRRTGSKWLLKDIRAPTICINARDDPFVEESSLPTEQDVQDAPVRLIYTNHGGHCGFIAEDNEKYQYGWLANEMARFLLHIHENL